MARLFDGVDDVIKCSIGGCNLTQPMSIAAIMRRNADGANHACLTLCDSSEINTSVSLFLNISNFIYYYTDTAASTASQTLVAADGWALIGVDKATGTGTPRFHRYLYGTNVWNHANGNSTANNTAPGASGKVIIGNIVPNDPSWINGDQLVLGLWNRRLSDAEWENLPFTLQAWYASAPKGLWLLDQAQTSQAVIDATGNGANQTAITGTAVATNHPKLFNRGDSVIYPSVVAAAAAAGQPTMRRWGGVPYMGPGPNLPGRRW